MRHTRRTRTRARHAEQRALGAIALACYTATLAVMLGAGYALLALALKAFELQSLSALARGGF
jgi:hypothetical protein